MYTPFSPDPTHSRAQGNIAYFERVIRSDPEKYVNSDEEQEEGGEREGDGQAKQYMSENERYKSLCRAPWPHVSTHNQL